jgi:hypothetical protein
MYLAIEDFKISCYSHSAGEFFGNSTAVLFVSESEIVEGHSSAPHADRRGTTLHPRPHSCFESGDRSCVSHYSRYIVTSIAESIFITHTFRIRANRIVTLAFIFCT